VVGDSFSAGRVWQTALTKAGLKVRTESWSSVREICEDFMPWLHGQRFNGKYVVFESIERSISDRVGRSVECKRMQFHSSMNADAPLRPPISSFNPDRGNYSGKLSVAIQTKIQALKYQYLNNSANFSSWNLPNHVRLAHIDHGCDLFSHAECNNALFLAEDSTEDLPENTLDNVSKINERLSGITPIWVFVPNKSTSYLYPNKQFWNEAERRVHAPNLLQMTQQAIKDKTIDLYPANNTHFSITGYLILGDLVYKNLQKK
jgi:hypothetical protein